MATYAELYDLRQDAALRNKVAVAVTIKAQTIFDLASPTAKQLAWAALAISGPDELAIQYLKYLMAKNAASTVAQINAASDATVQAAINALVDKLNA